MATKQPTTLPAALPVLSAFPTRSHGSALSALNLLFFMWGFITCMNDILVPFLKKMFDLSYFQAMLIQFTFFGAYFIGSLAYFLLSVWRGDPISQIGYKNGLVAGLLVSTVGCLLFYPAVSFHVYGLFLGALFVLGLGFTLLQIAANPYVIVLGTPQTASGRLNLSQAFTSLGSTIAPVLGGFLVFRYFAQWGVPLLTASGKQVKTEAGQLLTANSILIPYGLFAGVFLLLTVLIRMVHLPAFANTEVIEKKAGALGYGHLRRGMLAIFVYVGAEVCIGSFLINYMHESASLAENEAKTYLAFYWGGLMIGRFLGAITFGSTTDGVRRWLTMVGAALGTVALMYGVIWVESGFTFALVTLIPFLGLIALNLLAFYLGHARPHQTLLVFAVTIVGLMVVMMNSRGLVSVWLLVGVGLFNSVLWSNIFTLSISGLGRFTSQGSSLLIMSILGGALLPLLQGLLADQLGLQSSFVIPLLGYLYLAYYGWKGYAINQEQVKDQSTI